MSTNDDDATLQSLFYQGCLTCLQDGNTWVSGTATGNYVASCYEGSVSQCEATCVQGTSDQSYLCVESICSAQSTSTSCNSLANVQGTGYNCEWSSTLNLCTLNLADAWWSDNKGWVIALIVILLLCCIGGCVFAGLRGKKKAQPKSMETIIIQQGDSTAPYAQMGNDSAINANSQI